jgi:two-component system response regulator
MNARQSQPILLVEDSADDYEATSRAFKKVNLRNPVVWCQSGQAALDYLKQTGAHKEPNSVVLPGLVLLDLNMPGLDGRKTLQLIKQDEALKRIPVIILTTSADERDIKACYQLGANTYVQKPVSFDGLIEAIQRLKTYWFEFALLPKEAGK